VTITTGYSEHYGHIANVHGLQTIRNVMSGKITVQPNCMIVLHPRHNCRDMRRLYNILLNPKNIKLARVPVLGGKWIADLQYPGEPWQNVQLDTVRMIHNLVRMGKVHEIAEITDSLRAFKVFMPFNAKLNMFGNTVGIMDHPSVEIPKEAVVSFHRIGSGNRIGFTSTQVRPIFHKDEKTPDYWAHTNEKVYPTNRPQAAKRNFECYIEL